MRFSLTREFTQRLREHAEAYSTALRLEDEEGAVSERADREERLRLERLILNPAGTPEGLRKKLEIVFARDLPSFGAWDSGYWPAIERDLLDMRRPNTSLTDLFNAWRTIHEVHDTTNFDTDAAGDLVAKQHSTAYCALMRAPCTMPGDVLVKLYAQMLGALGPRGERRDGKFVHLNMWDPDIAEKDDARDHEDEWYRCSYDDLDHSDLGACLLAFGRTEFSAGDWLLRAQFYGILPRLMFAPDGSRSLTQPLHDGSRGEAEQREIRRLERLLAFDPFRYSLIMAEIEQRWPHLIIRPACLAEATAA